MGTLWQKLEPILREVLPHSSEAAINGTELLKRVLPRLTGGYQESSIRQHFSMMSKNPSSPIAKTPHRHGYYLRVVDTGNDDQHDLLEPSEASDSGLSDRASKGSTGSSAGDGETGAVPGLRVSQAEEKFRAIFLRHSRISNRYPLSIEHTRAVHGAGGLNKWKYPDVVVLEWAVGEVTDDGYRLDPHLLDVKQSLGEPPFRMSSIELKVELRSSTFRENFFQCVSNSKWAHESHLVVAADLNDEVL